MFDFLAAQVADAQQVFAVETVSHSLSHSAETLIYQDKGFTQRRKGAK
jgi:hypothetical protein